jgi:putative membrane protein
MIYLGLYEPMNAGIGALDFKVILPLILGVATSVLLFARIVNMLFKKHYTVISRAILGFVTASTLMIVPRSFASVQKLILSLVCFAAGFALTRVMDIVGSKQDKKTAKAEE